LTSILLTNGRVYRSALDESPASAILVRGGEIAWVGDANDAPPADVVRNLNGGIVAPGLTDSHIHLFAIAHNRLQLSLASGDETSIAAILEKLSIYAAENPRAEWVSAAGFNEERLAERRMPTRAELDAAVPDRPVLIRRYCGHAAIVNSAALRKLLIHDTVSDPPGGNFGRTAVDVLDGSAHEKAAEAIFATARTVEDDQMVSSIREAVKECNRLGLVAAVEAAVGFTSGFDEEERTWRIIRQQGVLPIRLGFMLQLDPSRAKSLGLTPQRDRNWQRTTLKYFADGIIGSRTAAVSEPYRDSCSCGFFVTPEAELAQAIIEAHSDGWQVAVHAIGERAIDCVITALETSQQAGPRLNARHRIEHYFCPPAGGFPRMRALGAMIVMQPGFLIRMNKSIRAALGERADHCYPGQSAIKAGVAFAASSDAPTGLLSPWVGMAAAIDRAASLGDAIGKEEALTARQAFAAYTSCGAHAMMQEDWRGRLAPGMAADLIVLDRDPFQIDVNELAQTRTLATMLRGEFVFEGGE
jgi:predicted amidohydrolase YtcJ